jgi:hypothetical protein
MALKKTTMRTASGIEVKEHITHCEFKCSEEVTCVLLHNFNKLNVVRNGDVIDTICIDPDTKMKEVYDIIERYHHEPRKESTKF